MFSVRKWFCLISLFALCWHTTPAHADTHADYLRFVQRLSPDTKPPHPEPNYRFRYEIHADIAPWVRDRPGVITPFRIGRTVENRPIWAFRIRDPARPVQHRVLVFAGIHALEWITGEVATAFITDLARQPVSGVEVVVVPLLNVDGRIRAQGDLRAGANRYRRSNAEGVDLNRDFAINRESDAIWKHIIPAYYSKSPGALSQPETRAIDALAGQEAFDVVVSLHAFGGFIYHPWAGLFARPDDWKAHRALGEIMQSGQGAHAYKVRQLSRWGFFFRALGSELDHFKGAHGAKSFLIELTRSGYHPLQPRTWKVDFRMYNPIDPTRHIALGTGALHALVGHLGYQAW